MDRNEEERLENAVSTHEKYMQSQGVPIYRGFDFPSLNEIEVGPWERLEAKGAYIDFEGAEANDTYILEIPPQGTVAPEKHLFEEIVYVLSGRGATTVWQPDRPKRTFEWHEGSLFALPLNAWHQFFNGQGDDAARFYVVSSAPVVMNLFHNIDFLFHADYPFLDRFDGRENFFSGEGQALPGRVWDSNFVEDIRTFPLLEWKGRGAGGLNRRFYLADSSMEAHISQFPVGTYKKAHRHGPGANVIIIHGRGYTLLWEDGKENKPVRVNWKEGSVLSPPGMWFHAHFNTGKEPAKYLAIHWGSRRYPFMPSSWGRQAMADVSVKEGGLQLEYEDEPSALRCLFEEELAKNGVPCRMPPLK